MNNKRRASLKKGQVLGEKIFDGYHRQHTKQKSVVHLPTEEFDDTLSKQLKQNELNAK